MPEPVERPTSDRQTRYGRILGLFFCLAGFIVIGFGWNGMAKVACPDCQLPYLLSGGAVGLGLIIVGAALLISAQVREERLKLAEQLDRIGSSISRSVSTSSNGSGELVVAGKSTYHRPDCRLVEGKADTVRISVEAAGLSGLSPCRVCEPPARALDRGRRQDAVQH
jgi:hypothetical protein